MQATFKPIAVTATQWFKDGDHPAVTGCTRRWANEEDSDAILSDKLFAESYGKRGMVQMGTVQPSGIIVEAGDWIVEESGEEPEVFSDAAFRKYFDLHPQAEPAAAPVVEPVVPAVVTPGPVDGEGAPVAETPDAAPETAPDAPTDTPADPTPTPGA